MTSYQIVLGSLLFAACSSSSLRPTNASGGSGGGTGGVLGTGGTATGGLLGTGGSGTGGVLGTGGSGTGGVLGTAISGAGGCSMAYCMNGLVGAISCFSNYAGYVPCDEAKSGVECVNLPGTCPVLDATNACDNRCAIDEICVAYFDGNCNSAGTACRKVSSSCKESVIVQGATCYEEPCNDDICGLKDGQGRWGCNNTHCAGDTSRADAKCYGMGDLGP